LKIILGIFAASIFLLYSLYFVRIIKGSQEEFEEELLGALAEWMISTGEAARRQSVYLIAFAILLEITYFLLTFLVIENPLLLAFTGSMVLLETLHVFSIINNFVKFFKGSIVLKQLFEWRVERICCMVFFTHSFLILASLIFIR
jgi:hypothetical protein